MQITIHDEDEARAMGYSGGSRGFSCLRPVGIRFTKTARLAYQPGWETGFEAYSARLQSADLK